MNLTNNIGPWWRHQMETFSALLAICAGHSPVPGEFPVQRPVTRSFDVFFDLRQIKRLNKHSRGWWFETLSRPLWRQSNADMVSTNSGVETYCRREFTVTVRQLQRKEAAMAVKLGFSSVVVTSLWCHLTVMPLVVVIYKATVQALHTRVKTQMWRDNLDDWAALRSSDTTMASSGIFKYNRFAVLPFFCCNNTLLWRHNDHDSVSNHQPRGCLLSRLFRRRSKKTSKLRVTGLCVGNSLL